MEAEMKSDDFVIQQDSGARIMVRYLLPHEKT